MPSHSRFEVIEAMADVMPGGRVPEHIRPDQWRRADGKP